MEEDSTSTLDWDWDSLLNISLDAPILPWDSPPPPPPPSPPPPLATAPAAPSRVRKRDPRLVCENYLAGRIPCACPEMDALLMEDASASAAAAADEGARKRSKGSVEIRCQVAGCEADIRELKGYHRRHRVCLRCASASSVLIDGADRRYCQQCGKFHLLADFDEGKRSCRRKLEKHNNRRRRKPTDCLNLMENEKEEPQRNLPADAPHNGEVTPENKFDTEVAESNKVADGEMLLESENGHGSPISLLPSSQDEPENSIASFAARGEARIDEEKDNPKSSISSTMKNTYSSVCPTGRISFKLYDWNPAEFPRRLRHQIFEWLSSMPVELEGYIRPGCTILTIFIAMPQFMWEQLSRDASLYIKDLINAPESLFLGRGNIFIYLNNMIIHLLKDGTSLLNVKMEVKAPRIHYVHPAYFEAGKPVEFVACGSNLDQRKFRFLVSIGGKYLVLDLCHAISHGKMGCDDSHGDSFSGYDHEIFRIRISQTDSKLFGPAFIEVENESGISNFIPVIFGNKQICSELERLQGALIGSSSTNPGCCELFSSKQNELSELITDIAWLLKGHDMDIWETVTSVTHVQRLTCLLKFSIQNECCAVLEAILKYWDGTIGMQQKLESFVPYTDLKLLVEYINCAKEILNQRVMPDDRSESYMGSPVQRISEPNSDVIAAMNKDSGERNRADVCSVGSSIAEVCDENVPLVCKKSMTNKERCYPHLNGMHRQEPWFSMYSSSRFSVFVMVSIILCLVACVVFIHPLDAGGLVVSIRRRLFGNPFP